VSLHLSAPQVRISEEYKLNAATQQFITAKISDCAIKQGSKTPSPVVDLLIGQVGHGLGPPVFGALRKYFL